MKRIMLTALVLAFSFASGVSAQGVGSVMADTNGTVRTPRALEARIARAITNETDAAAMAAIGVLDTNTVKVADTNGWETGAHKAWLTNETDAAALAFAATNRVRTWSDPDDAQSWWVDNDTNRVKYTRTVSGTNFVVTLSANFEETLTHTRPALPNNVYPFSEGQWTGLLLDSLNGLLSFDSGESTYARWENITVNQYPMFLLPVENAQGTATVSISSYSYITNVAAVYILTTGDVWTAIGTAQATADDALTAAGNAQGAINGHAPLGTIAAPHLILGDRALIDSISGKAAINGGTLSNATFAGTVTLTNGTSFAAGSYYGTNGVFFTRDGTNNWILF